MQDSVQYPARSAGYTLLHPARSAGYTLLHPARSAGYTLTHSRIELLIFSRKPGKNFFLLLRIRLSFRKIGIDTLADIFCQVVEEERVVEAMIDPVRPASQVHQVNLV